MGNKLTEKECRDSTSSFSFPAKSMVILAVETSCDDTAVSLVLGEWDKNLSVLRQVTILAHEVSSQTEIHSPFGGVVPEVAARDHLAKLFSIAQRSLAVLGSTKIQAVAVTMGPGLIGALMVGVLFARGLADSLGVPLLAINHVDAHLAPALLLTHFSPNEHLNVPLPVVLPDFPILSLTASGGHCHMRLHETLADSQILGWSLDDACGEAFDKVSVLLGFGYPGGPMIEQLAHASQSQMGGLDSASQHDYNFPYQMHKPEHRYHFSYSGLKTAVVQEVRKKTNILTGKVSGQGLDLQTKQNLAYAFQKAALLQLSDRVHNALTDFPQIKSVIVAGGVAQNQFFRTLFSRLPKPVRFAPPSLCSDNATMIALQALLGGGGDGFFLHPFSRYQFAH